MKQRIRLTESGLHRIIKQTVKKVLNEGRGYFGNMVDVVTEKFNELYSIHKNEVDEYIVKLKASRDFKDFETRLAWDLARATHYLEWMPKDEQGFVAGTDSQMTTLFKQALHNSDIEY